MQTQLEEEQSTEIENLTKEVEDSEKEIEQLKEKLKHYTEPFKMRPTYQVLEQKLEMINEFIKSDKFYEILMDNSFGELLEVEIDKIRVEIFKELKERSG